MSNKIRELDTRGLTTTEMARPLLIAGSRAALASYLGVDAPAVEMWIRDGVPSGPTAAALRHFTAINWHVLNIAKTVRCVVCDVELYGTTEGMNRYYPCCSDCVAQPTHTASLLGFEVKNTEQGRRVRAPRSFELPLAATIRRQRFADPPDVEVDDAAFDDAMFLQTDDYPALFDLLQHEGRRALLLELARLGTVVINVDEVTQIRGQLSIEDHTWADHCLILLVRSLVHETANYR